jgi:anti-anti-sigma regulatory factor
VDEGSGSVLDFIKTLSDLVDAAEEQELILDFDQVITVVSSIVGVLGSVNTSRHHDSE